MLPQGHVYFKSKAFGVVMRNFKKEVLTNDESLYFIAEIGINHNGVYPLAEKMILQSKEAGAQAVKFQKRNAKMLLLEGVTVDTPTGYLSKDENDLPTESKAFGTWDYPDERLEFSDEEHLKLWEYANSLGLDYIASPWDENSLNFLVNNDAKVIKIASIDTNNFWFMKLVASKGIPVIASTGMCTWDDVTTTWKIFKDANCPLMFLHCTSAYPCPIEDKNLNCIKVLRSLFSQDVGFSGHGTGFLGTLGAVALGANVVEKHVTLSRQMSGPDQAASLEFDEFKDLISQATDLQKAMGSTVKKFENSEKTLHDVLAKRLVLSKDVNKGEVIKHENVRTVVTKTGNGLLPNNYFKILNKPLKRDLKKNHILELSDLSDE